MMRALSGTHCTDARHYTLRIKIGTRTSTRECSHCWYSPADTEAETNRIYAKMISSPPFWWWKKIAQYILGVSKSYRNLTLACVASLLTKVSILLLSLEILISQMSLISVLV